MFEKIKGNKVGLFIFISTCIIISIELIIFFVLPDNEPLKYYLVSNKNYQSKYILMATLGLFQLIPIAIGKFYNYFRNGKKELIFIQVIILITSIYLLVVNL